MAADAPPPSIEDFGAAGGELRVHQGRHARVLFGVGAAHRLGEEVDRLGAARVAVMGTPDRHGDVEDMAARLGPRAVAVLPEAVMHSPVEVSDRVARAVRDAEIDLLISTGGGSSIGLGKAVSLRTGLPHLTIPTTYSGSELTPILGETANGVKLTKRDDALRPAVVIYDPALTLGVPARVAVASGMNAIAHAVEALYMADDADVLDRAAASIRHLRTALAVIAHNPRDLPARVRALYGAWLAGFCLAESPMALHHKLCHVLGGAFDMPHAETHAAVLPHALAYNAPAIPTVYARMAPLLGDLAEDPSDALFALVGALDLPRDLRSLGLPRDGIAEVVRLACENAYANPRPLEREGLTRLLERAWAGDKPVVDMPVDA